MLPFDLLNIIGRYLYVVDVIHAQIAFRTIMEFPSILRLRHKFEPYQFKGMHCTYTNSTFVIKWKGMKIYDKSSKSSKLAVIKFYKLINTINK